MPARKYEPGQYLNGILLLREAEKTNGNPHRRGEFQCPHCQNIFIIWFQNVLSGNTKSCGCQQYIESHGLKHGHNRIGKRSPTYETWARMIDRCNNSNGDNYPNYGGRGIKICEKWLSFEGFLEDMGERPEGKTLDRYPDMNGNYELSNCRWASDIEQARNTRRTIKVEYKGKIVALKDLSEKFRINHDWALMQHRKGASLAEILRGKPGNFIPHSFGVIAA